MGPLIQVQFHLVWQSLFTEAPDIRATSALTFLELIGTEPRLSSWETPDNTTDSSQNNGCCGEALSVNC